jgi:uncharacterized damage-inducible protein DinB
MRELFGHQAWADAELLRAVAAHAGASSDEKLLGILHHIVFVQRVFGAMLTGAAFDIQTESQPVESLAALQRLYTASHSGELSFMSGLTIEALDRPVENPWAPDLKGTVAEILMQVVLHSQNHRGQCLSRLRELAGKAPVLDFIIWLKLGRPKELVRQAAAVEALS